MKKSVFSLLLVLACAATSALAQGGKAEPKRIQFAPGKSSAKLAGRLSNAQEMDYIFTAGKGQTVTISNATAKLFDIRVFNEEHHVETEFDSSPTLTIENLEAGEYLVFVRKRQVRSPRAARFAVTLTVKDRPVITK